MRTSLSTISVLLIFLVAAGATAGPRLTIPVQDFNFGMAPQHVRISHVFWLYNSGDDSLRIINVKPGCGCTQAPLERKRLGPGDSTRLEIIFSTKSYRGRVVKSPTIMTNEGGQPHRIRIHAEIMEKPMEARPVNLTPARMDLVDLPRPDQGRFEVGFENHSDIALHPVLIDAPEDLINFDLPEEIPAGGTATAVVEMTELGLTKPFIKSATIELDDADRTRLTLPLKYQPYKPISH